MRAHVAADVGGGTATAPLLAKPNEPRVHTGRLAVCSLFSRAIQIIGRTVLGLPPSTWMILDVSVLQICVYSAFVVYPPPVGMSTPHVALWQASAVFAMAVIVSSLVFGLYERETILSRSRIVTRLGLTTTTTAVISYAVIYVLMYATVSRRVSALALMLFVVGGAMVRLGAWWVAHKVNLGLLVVGPRALHESFERAKANGFLHEYRLVGYATTNREKAKDDVDSKCVGPIREQVDRLEHLDVTDVVVGGDVARDPTVMDWVVKCLKSGCRVTDEAIFYEKATGQILVDEITPAWFLFADLKGHCDQHTMLKRLTDVVIAGIGLCLSAPLWLLIALAIKLCDGGPVFYYQDRVGLNGHTFRLYKFRTMRPDAENGKSVWCLPNDPRITYIGRFLRRTRLDELPQLYNVLAGQMSIVGPRPERPDIVRDLCLEVPFYAERHLIKPGITGWAQISYRYGSSVEDAKRKLQFDLFYLKQMSFELDMVILFRTVGTFLRGGC